MDIFENMKLVPGAYMEIMCDALNTKGKSLAMYKSLEPSKMRWKVLRAQKKKVDDKYIEKDGSTCECGDNELKTLCIHNDLLITLILLCECCCF